ncbi:MAG: DEAD/DEAH box helicase family protein [Holdemanella sp.]|nr:DEAD/DEAH box helicase family protein [Holdemanella sp.]
MKLKFVEQQYQTDAVNSICDLFEGCQIKDSLFTIDMSQDVSEQSRDIEGMGYAIGHANRLTISDADLLENTQNIQAHHNIMMSKDLNGKNFTIEMETGTGKTYVYTKTILELNKRYGMTKFIIVVPSIAIKEGVYKSFQNTEEHFRDKYDNVIYSYFVYDSNNLNRIQTFATSINVEIMIINIDAFRKSFDDPNKDTKANIIHRESDKLSGNKPIDLISSTNPIVIIDEPQSVDGTKKSEEAIASLNPMVTLRYSATHKKTYNLMYRLTPVDAYNEHLVKSIEVASIVSKDASAKPYVKLLSVSDKNGFSCRIEIYVKNKKSGAIEKKSVKAKQNDDIWELSNEVDYYKDGNYIIDNIDCFPGEENVSLVNGEFINLGNAIGEISNEAIKKAQIKETIRMHLDKEIHYAKRDIKVLSLFFIDEVAKYRDYSRDDEKGDYARWFEEEYSKLIQHSKYKKLLENEKYNISADGSSVHEGYFSQDGKGRLKNSSASGSSKDDETAYQLIMKDKEKLLSFDEPIRFIFSHSALKEGWDNPNVFQICTLVESNDIMTKRQKIGRGLRICVNQDGERVLNSEINVLSVVANESYKDFASTLQREMETDNFKFGIIEPVSFAGLVIKQLDGKRVELKQSDSKEIFGFLVDNKYLTPNGKVTTKYYIDKRNGSFNLPDKYESYAQKIDQRIDALSKEIEIKDVHEKVKVSLNKEVVVSPEFSTLWNKIRQKTRYSVNMDIDKLKEEAINQIKMMPRIKADQIDGEINKLKMDKSGISSSCSREYQLGKISEFEKQSYPDVVRRLQDATDLLRSTIVDILVKSTRFNDFYVNPEDFIKRVSNILLNVKKENLTNGIQYRKVDEYYNQETIFDDDALYGNRGSNLLEIDANKNVFDYVIYDSEVEKNFAIEAENDPDVVLYAKLPSRFTVDTPLGKYNPDWAVVINDENQEKVYFVTETKGTTNLEDLKGSEKKKILCGRKHFEVLDNEIRYVVAKELKDLRNII